MANCFYIGYFKSQVSVSLPANSDGTCPPSPTSGYSGSTLVTFNAPADLYGVTISPSEYQQIMQAASGMPDPVTGAAIWFAFFSVVIGCYVVAKPAGAILAFLRDS